MEHKLKGSYNAISSVAFSLGCYKLIDKIPEVAKAEVSKPKRYSLSKLRLIHTLLKRLILNTPHMSTSRGDLHSSAQMNTQR